MSQPIVQKAETSKTEILQVRSLPSAVVPRNSHWTIDAKGMVSLLEINGRLVSTGVKVGRKAVKY